MEERRYRNSRFALSLFFPASTDHSGYFKEGINLFSGFFVPVLLFAVC